MLEGSRVPCLGPGRPRTRPDHVLGDKGYSSKAIRTWLRRRGIPHTIPERADQARNRARRGSHGGRPPAFDPEVYKHRNVVERRFNRLKQWRGVATRYDETSQSYEAAVTLVSLLMRVRQPPAEPRSGVFRRSPRRPARLPRPSDRAGKRLCAS
ncbi:transposase [Streptomyces sp. SAS_281]